MILEVVSYHNLISLEVPSNPILATYILKISRDSLTVTLKHLLPGRFQDFSIEKVRDDGQNMALFALKCWSIGGAMALCPPPWNRP